MTSSTSAEFFKDGTPKKRKARFSFTEVHILLDEVRKNRRIVVGKFNRGVPSALKKRTWAEITARINEIAECEREVSEVIRKWSDLKFDIKRKVKTTRAGSAAPPGSHFQRQSPVDKIIRDILDLNGKPGRRQASKGRRSNGSRNSNGASVSSGEEDDGVGEEEEDMDMMAGVGSLQSSPEVGEGAERASITGAKDPSITTPPLLQTFKQEDTEQDALFDSAGDTSFEMSFEMPTIEDAGLQDNQPSSSSRLATFAIPPPPPAPSLPPPSVRAADRGGGGDGWGMCGADVGEVAALSVQEQHMSNALLETVSRSLELLAESVQTLAETQQEFMRESLQLQTDTVQVLRDFASGAMALMQEKLNGRPAH